MQYSIKNMFYDKEYLKNLFALALPVALQSMLNMIVNFADTMMIGKLGDQQIASVGLANKVFFIFILLIFGIQSGAGILVSQYWGKGDIRNIRNVLGIALILGFSSSIIFTSASYLVPEFLMGIFSTSESTIRIGASYLIIVCFSYPFTAVTSLYTATMRATEQVKIPLITTMVAILINISFNYLLIFGKFGFPQMGIAGAALATVLARIVEMFLLLFLARIIRHPIICSLKKLLGFQKNLILRFIKTCSPVIANEFMWGVGTTVYFVVYGRMGDEAVAAITIATTLSDILNVTFIGIASATVVIHGMEMGANRLEKARKYGTYSFYMGIMAGLLCSAVVILTRESFVGLYNISDELHRDIIQCLTVFAIFAPFKALSTVNIVGILRSGGDTVACFLLDLSGVWFIGVPLAFIGGLFLKLPVHIVYGMVLLEEVYKVIAGYFRYRQRKWLKNLTI